VHVYCKKNNDRQAQSGKKPDESRRNWRFPPKSEPPYGLERGTVTTTVLRVGGDSCVKCVRRLALFPTLVGFRVVVLVADGKGRDEASGEIKGMQIKDEGAMEAGAEPKQNAKSTRCSLRSVDGGRRDARRTRSPPRRRIRGVSCVQLIGQRCSLTHHTASAVTSTEYPGE